MSNEKLIANLRGENLDCCCAAWSRSECFCSTNWPESFCDEAADALSAADKRIAELERKLTVAREALEDARPMLEDDRAYNAVVEALAQIGDE